MNTRVKLKELIEEMQCQFDEVSIFLHRNTGNLISVSEKEFCAAESEDGPEFDLNDYDEDFIRQVRDILDNEDDYVTLPSEYDINEYEMIEAFCESLMNVKNRNDLLKAIQGSGAFGRFKRMIQERGLEEDWYRFKDEKYKEIAIQWCNENNIDYI